MLTAKRSLKLINDLVHRWADYTLLHKLNLIRCPPLIGQ